MKIKTIIPAIALSLCSLLAVSCGSSESSLQEESTAPVGIDYSKVEYGAPLIDEEIPTFDGLIKESEIIMIGEVIDDGIPEIKYEDQENYRQPYSSNTLQTLKVIKVFKGIELIEGDTLDIYHNYAFATNTEGKWQLLSATNLAPIYKGDKAIFLLSYNEAMKRYIPVGTYGRFPLPEDRGKTDRLGCVDGLITGIPFNEEYYKKLIEMYNIT